jgi:hypothetical protein
MGVRWDLASTSTGFGFDNGVASSKETTPLLIHIRIFFFLFCNYMFCCSYNQIVAPDHMNNIKSFFYLFSIFF